MKLKILSVALALAAFTATPARADWSTPGVVCGGNNFATCLSASVSWSGSVLTVVVTNADPYGANFAAVGLINLDDASDVIDWTKSTPPTGTWDEVSHLSGGGLPGELFAIGPNSAPNTNGLLNGATGTFTFTFDHELSDAEVATIGVGVHGISGPAGCSTKFGVLSTGVVDNAIPASYEECGTTVIPEPVTMVLMGTGLAGIAAARRRRNGVELIDENGENVEI